jgi:hypothetical protein
MGDDLKNLGIYVSQVISLALKPPPPHVQVRNQGRQTSSAPQELGPFYN